MSGPRRVLLVFWVILSLPGIIAADGKMGKKMDAKAITIPFNLNPQDLLKVEFLCEYQPPGAKSWSEAVRISGVTGVALFRLNPDSPKTDSLVAKQNPQALITLLKIFEDRGFFESEANMDSLGTGSRRFISLSIPGQSNRVTVAGREVDQLNQLLGAVKFAAGISLPEALTKAYLQNL